MNRSSTVIVNTVILCTVNIIFTFVGIFLNSVVIVSLLNSQLRRKLCYFMILVLSCFDLAVVVVFHPLIIVLTVCWMPTGCDKVVEVWKWLQRLFTFSLTSLLTMTVERYFALVYPFFHHNYATRSRLMVVFLVFQLPFGVFYFLSKDDAKKYILLLIGAIFLVICGINLKLFCLSRAMRLRVDIPLGSLDNHGERNAASNKSKVSSANLGKISTCLLAVVCLFICYCPLFVFIGLELRNEIKKFDMYYITMKLWAETFLTLNSTLNCLIFFYKNSALRRHGMNLLKKCVSCCYERAGP